MKKKKWVVGLMIAVIAAIVLLVVAHSHQDGSGFKVLCMGDSLTESEFGYYPAHLRGLLKKQGVDALIYSAARPGHNSGEYLKFLKTSELVEKVKPDLAIIMLGTNDIRIDRDHTTLLEYRRNMIEIIRMVKGGKGSPPVIFLASIPPIFRIDLKTFDETSKRRVENEIVPAVQDLARLEQLHYLDIHGFFFRRPELMAGIHPRKKGYYAMALFIFNKIIPFLRAG